MDHHFYIKYLKSWCVVLYLLFLPGKLTPPPPPPPGQITNWSELPTPSQFNNMVSPYGNNWAVCHNNSVLFILQLLGLLLYMTSTFQRILGCLGYMSYCLARRLLDGSVWWLLQPWMALLCLLVRLTCQYSCKFNWAPASDKPTIHQYSSHPETVSRSCMLPHCHAHFSKTNLTWKFGT